MNRLLVAGFILVAGTLGLGAQTPSADTPPAPAAIAVSTTQAESAQRAETTTSGARNEEALKVKADWQNLNCRAPRWHPEADLCQQVRVADAAERTVWLNVAQVGIGTITFGLLVLTALYGYRSANAAREAATASLKAADVADRAMKISNRPYVLVKEVRLSLWSLRPKAFVTLQNYGQTPAFAVSSNLDLLHTNDPEQTSKMPEEIFQSSPLAPNDPWDFTVASQIQTIPEQWEHVKEGKLFWRLAGTIVYRDIFGEQHITLVNYVYGQRYSLRETGHMVPGRVGNDAG